ncbi:MAG: hypothetical protein Q8Q41_02815 [bacterium]|nr:hypothetical protein [bacterium]
MHRRTRCGGYLAIAMLVVSCSTALWIRQVDVSEAPVSIPDVENWKDDCGEKEPTEFFLLKFCKNPDGSGEIGVRGYHRTKGREVYIGKAWGIYKDPVGGLIPVNLSRLQVLLMLEDGREFLGAPGVKPEMSSVDDRYGNQVGIKLRLKSANGTYAERVIMADNAP